MEKPKQDPTGQGPAERSSVKAALAELKTVMLNPDPALKNQYQHYSYSQLDELIEEITDEFDKLPPFAFSKLTELQSQVREIQEAVEIKRMRGDVS